MSLFKLLAVNFTVLTTINSSFGQTPPPADSGKIEIIQEFKLPELLAKHVELNSRATVKGYRVKIHFGTDKTQAYEVKKKFLELYPTVSAYVKYDQPNFNVRVGDFRTKLEAYKFFKTVQSEFPAAFLVQDEIEFNQVNALPAATTEPETKTTEAPVAQPK